MKDHQVAQQLNLLMIDQIKRSGQLRSSEVEQAFRTVLRHTLLPSTISAAEAYTDTAIVLKRASSDGIVKKGAPSSSSTMPSLLAAVLEAARMRPGLRVLQVGTGPGYLAALIGQLVGGSGLVVSVEIDEEISAGSARRLSSLGFANIRCVANDACLGYPELAPYDRVIVTAGCAELPSAWEAGLSEGGSIILPLSLAQRAGHYPMVVLEKQKGGLEGRIVPGLVAVGFLPLYGGRVSHPLIYDGPLVRLEGEIASRLAHDGKRGVDSQSLYLLAMLCIADWVEANPRAERVDVNAVHAGASEFLSRCPEPRVERFRFALRRKESTAPPHEWRFRKEIHDLYVDYR